VPHNISGVRYTTWLLPELFSSEHEIMKKLKMDMSNTDLIILGEVRFDTRNLSTDSRALLLLEVPGFILFFLLLMFMIKLYFHFYLPCFIDYFMPNAVLGERHIELF
jgi:hypothetical protein